MRDAVRDGIRKILTINQLNRKYRLLKKRVLDVLADVQLPYVEQLPYVNAYAEVRGSVSLCSGEDPLLAELADCAVNFTLPQFVIVGIELNGDLLIIHGYDIDWWTYERRANTTSLHLNSLRSAYILYMLGKTPAFMQALDELEKARKDAKKAVGLIKKSIDFIGTLMQTMESEAHGDVDKGNDVESVNVDGKEVRRIYQALKSIMEGKPGEIPIYVDYLPSILQYTSLNMFRLIHGEDIVKKFYYWLDEVDYIDRIVAFGTRIDVRYYNRKDDKYYWSVIDMDTATLADFFFLINLEENYGTLSYIADTLSKMIKRVSKALQIAEELAALIKIVGGGHE